MNLNHKDFGFDNMCIPPTGWYCWFISWPICELRVYNNRNLILRTSFSSLLCVHQDTRLFCEVFKHSRCTNKASSWNPFAHCFVDMPQDCFVWYTQGFRMSQIRCPMMPLDTHTPCISNSYKCSPSGKHTFIEELFKHAGCWLLLARDHF